MDICVLNPYFYPQPGGTEHVLLELYKRLAKRHSVTVLTSSLKPGSEEATDTVEGMKVVRLKTKLHRIPGLPLPLLEMEGLDRRIKENGADIYHINNRYQYFHRTLDSIKGTGSKLALTIHNALPQGINAETDIVGYLYDVVWGRALMRSSDIITAVSENAMMTTVPRECHGRTCVISNGVDHDKFMPRRGSREARAIRRELGMEDGKIILNTARLVAQKGQVYLIRAVARLSKKIAGGEKVSLLIIGKGPLRAALEREARACGIADRFRIIDSVPEDRMQYYYNAADVYAMPSLYEPAAVAVLEAMSSGLPMVVSDVGGLPELVERAGLYSGCRDVDGIAAGLLRLLQDRRRAGELGLKARDLAVRRHDWDSLAKVYERKFEGAVKG